MNAAEYIALAESIHREAIEQSKKNAKLFMTDDDPVIVEKKQPPPGSSTL